MIVDRDSNDRGGDAWNTVDLSVGASVNALFSFFFLNLLRMVQMMVMILLEHEKRYHEENDENYSSMVNKKDKVLEKEGERKLDLK